MYWALPGPGLVAAGTIRWLHDKKPRANPPLLLQLQERLRRELAGVISITAKLRNMSMIGMEVR